MLESVPENTIDFVYDIGFHDRIFATRNTMTDRPDKYKRAFELSSEILNKEVVSNYDYLILISDHGYADYHRGYNQHIKEFKGKSGEYGLGNPMHHSCPILYIVDMNKEGSLDTEDCLINQVDVSNFIFNLMRGADADELTNYAREYIVTHGASVYERGYPLIYHIIYKDEFKSFYFDRLGEYGFEGISTKTSFIKDKEEEYKMTKEDWDILYTESRFIEELFDYNDFKLNDYDKW